MVHNNTARRCGWLNELHVSRATLNAGNQLIQMRFFLSFNLGGPLVGKGAHQIYTVAYIFM